MEVMMVKKSILAAFFECSICKRTVVDATTINLCLHTFCRRCIYRKLTDEGETCCPVCRVYLGNDPVEKLRVDHNLREVRAILFPDKEKMLPVSKAQSSIAEPSSAKPSIAVTSLPKPPIAESSTANPLNEEPTNIEDMTLYSIYLEAKSKKAKAKKKASASCDLDAKQTKTEGKKEDNSANSGDLDQE